ncbi:MAG TPA: substrate-binding domain-containing protein [Solirubrobacteraceae bacterium]|nr:substrate-binding domain-containing protein [Solirubrobacteraceae bacterium]
MSDEDFMGDIVERLEWDERKEPDSPAKRMKQVTRRTALTGGAAGIAAIALQACGGSSHKTANTGTSTASASTTSSSGSSAASAIFGVNAAYKFVVVNHVTTNPFFTPTQSGIHDACKLLGIPQAQWTGSATSNVGQMVTSINNAVAAKADGIATTLVATTSFNAPVKKAMDAGIPVVSYNSDVPSVDRLAYIGQDLFKSGVQMGQKILSLVPSGQIALFIATPGSLNIQPRINGAESVLKGHSSIKYDVVATGAQTPQELSTINSWASSHSSAKGMFAVDAGSTQSLGQVLLKQGLYKKGWKGGGFDLTPITQKLISHGILEFTIDQQPYLQGFLPILQLYMYKATQSLTGPADTDTGLKFLTKSTVGPYVNTKSRYEGTSTQAGVQKA